MLIILVLSITTYFLNVELFGTLLMTIFCALIALQGIFSVAVFIGINKEKEILQKVELSLSQEEKKRIIDEIDKEWPGFWGNPTKSNKQKK